MERWGFEINAKKKKSSNIFHKRKKGLHKVGKHNHEGENKIQQHSTIFGDEITSTI